MSDELNAEIGHLFELMIDRSATPEQRQRLADLIAADEAARQIYLQYCQTHSMLAWENGSLTAAPLETAVTLSPADQNDVRVTRGVDSPDARAAQTWRVVAITACGLLVACLGWVITQQGGRRAETSRPVDPDSGGGSVAVAAQGSPTEPATPTTPPTTTIAWNAREVVAVLTTGHGADLQLTELHRAIAAGEQLRTGRYLLQRGFVKLTFTNDIEVVMESPAEFELQSEMQMIVHQGRMSARVSPAGHGFVVETPSARLVDYGTEFSIDASDSSSEVHVFDGEVTVRPHDAPADAEDLRLTANQATLIHAGCGIPAGIDIDHGRFVRTLGEAGDTSDAGSDYGRTMRRWQPESWYRMSFAEDGVTLTDHGTQPSDGLIETGRMKPAPFKPGRIGTGLFLGGPATGAYVRVPNYQPATTGQLTVAAWVQAKSRPRWAAIAKHWAIEFNSTKTDYSGPGGQFHLGLHEDDGGLELQVRDEDGRVIQLRERKPIALQQWVHVAFVVDGEQVRLYRDGQLIDQAACQGLATDGPPALGIGIKLNAAGSGPNPTNPGYWHGRIDELLQFHRALTADELRELYDVSSQQRRKIARLP